MLGAERRSIIAGSSVKGDGSMTTTYAQHERPPASLEGVRVAEAMHRGVVTCRPETSLQTVARLMAAHRIHAVVVEPAAGTSGWSLVTDLDLAAAVAGGLSSDLTAGHVSSSPELCVRPDETLVRAAQLMRDHETHHLLVLAHRGDRPAGVISTLDVADVAADLPRPRR
jgi:CBS domain-containing protein